MSRVGISHKKFWKLSWYEISLYIALYQHRQQELATLEENEWKRWRVLAVDFKNAHRRPKTKMMEYLELIRFPSDEKKIDTTSKPNLRAAKKLLGSKFNLN